MNKFLHLGLGVAVSALFLWLVLRATPWESLTHALTTISYPWLTAAVALFVADYTLRIHHWHLMLKPENPALTWPRCMVPFMASIAANNVLPFRAGDALRAVGFSNWLGIPTSTLVATLLVERLMDFLTLLAALGLALTLLPLASGTTATLLGGSGTMLLFTAAALATVLVCPKILEVPTRHLLPHLTRIIPSFGNALTPHLNRLFSTLHTLSQGPLIVPLLGWSALIWALEATVFYAVAQSLPTLPNTAAAWLAMPMGTLSTLLPSTPGYIGTFHFFVAQAAQALGNPAAAAAVFALFTHAVLWLGATLWGGACFLQWVWATSHNTAKQNT